MTKPPSPAPHVALSDVHRVTLLVEARAATGRKTASSSPSSRRGSRTASDLTKPPSAPRVSLPDVRRLALSFEARAEAVRKDPVLGPTPEAVEPPDTAYEVP